MEGYSGLVLLAAPRVRARIRPVLNLSDSKNLSNQNKDFNAILKKKPKTNAKKIHDT